MQCPRCFTEIPAGAASCAQCGALVGPPAAAPTVAAARPTGTDPDSRWGPPGGSGPPTWASEPPAFPPPLPPAGQPPTGPPPYGVNPNGGGPPPTGPGTSPAMIFAAIGAAVIVALVVVTAVVYATRPSADATATGPTTTVPPSSVTTTKPPTTTSSGPQHTTSTESVTTEEPATTTTTDAPGKGPGKPGSTDWVSYQPKGVDITVEFPSKPKTLKTGDNEALKNADLVQLTVPGGVYMLMTLELPTHLDAQAMRTVASTLASGMSEGSTIDDVKTSTYQGEPAVTFAVAGTGASAGKGFGVSSGTTFVLLIATGSADADHFFQSLTIG